MRTYRPMKLAQEIIEEAAGLLPRTHYLATVATLLDVHPGTIRRWLRRGGNEQRRLLNRKAKPRPSEPIYLQFYIAWKKGLAEGEIRALGIMRAGSVEAREAERWLEHKFPKRWGRNHSILAELVKQVKELQTGAPKIHRRFEP